MGKKPFFGPTAGFQKDFVGLDLGVGAQFILGIDLQLKIGRNYRK